MQNRMWDRPVRVGDELIFSPFQAHQFARSKWPHTKDAEFAGAYDAILAALDGRVSPDEARVKFESALKSARLS
ncbi:protein of unknown function DUF982 [Rhizobium sp. CF080]|uniref:DUF982 domain-containing protein n=1 Tax=Rhizobium sp. (strain CF080) TaxID=1144310 RepID=UPI000271A39C|nr:DUF982 domain-containing protein [Rhizobium sp. CF080]EUB98089.1 protein of unknown function DUF982 [Rhizobium sp. CF080]